MYSKRTLAFSVALHLALVVVLTVSIDFGPDEVTPAAAPRDIVQAVVVDQSAVDAELARLEAAEEKKRLEQAQRETEVERKAREAEKKRKTEEKRLAELEAERKRLTRKKEEEKKKAEEAKRKAQEAEAQAAREAEARRKAEAEREAEEQRKAEQARRQREQEAREAERKRIEQALQNEIEAEEAARVAAEREAAEASEIARYTAAIAARVRQSFTILPGLDGLSCTLRITLIPGGEVAQVTVVKSSGNATFDRQAENAVRKAAPLPVPTDPRLFQKMRNISFVFDPKT